MVALAVLFIGSGIGACRELQYAISGRVAEAQITRVRQHAYAEEDEDLKAVTYRFHEEDGTQREDKMVKRDWRPPKDDRLTIEYIPNSPGTSRLYGESESERITVFVVMLCLMVGAIIWPGRPARPSRRALQ
ncbi:MAG: hypothetical protein C4547_02970 [Phycisphaerales bacterium]|nr:MAG: hypothetical protein C4547_02970 [Phycisphaerales bacterium]